MIEKRVVILHVSHQELKLRGFNFVSYLATLLATETPYFAAGLLILLGAEKNTMLFTTYCPLKVVHQ
jgi:alpha/beta superfamily hydrolase